MDRNENVTEALGLRLTPLGGGPAVVLPGPASVTWSLPVADADAAGLRLGDLGLGGGRVVVRVPPEQAEGVLRAMGVWAWWRQELLAVEQWESEGGSYV